MEEHCSIGLVVTTDGTITDIPRADYIAAERRAITDMQATGKPFLTIINTRTPNSENAAAVKEYLRSEFGVDAIITDCQSADTATINEMLRRLLYAFPMTELRIYLPRWMDALEQDHPVKAALYEALMQCAGEIATLAQAEASLVQLKQLEQVRDFTVRELDLATGTVSCALGFPEKLFYEILSSRAGVQIRTDAELLSLLTTLSQAKQEYDQVSDALSSVRATGYGIVMPTASQMKLETPELTRKGGVFGVKMKASAPSIHMIRVDIDTEITPTVGDEKQSQDMISYLSGESPEKLWQSNIFGKSVYDLIQEGLTAKIIRLPEDVRSKFRGSLSRIINEGASSLICIIL